MDIKDNSYFKKFFLMFWKEEVAKESKLIEAELDVTKKENSYLKIGLMFKKDRVVKMNKILEAELENKLKH